jgi:hypothetical protein
MPKMKQSGSKKTRLTPTELPNDRKAGGSGSAGGRNLREHAPKRRSEELEFDLGGDTGRMRTMLTLMFFVCSIIEKG